MAKAAKTDIELIRLIGGRLENNEFSNWMGRCLCPVAMILGTPLSALVLHL